MRRRLKVIPAFFEQNDIQYHGRWYLQGNLPTASWASATIRLAFSGRQLVLIPGPESTRIDLWNGGTKTVVVRSRFLDADMWSIQDVIDVEAGRHLVLFSSEESKRVEIEVMLVDWATRFQIESFAMGEGDMIIPLHRNRCAHRFLFIGDSITSGFCGSDNDGCLPRGVMDAYPFACQQMLGIHDVSIGVIAFPGIKLVGERGKKGAEAGMAVKFKHESSWMEENPWSFTESVEGYGPTVIVIALGVNDEENDVPVDTFVETYASFLLELVQRYQSSLKQIIVLSPWSPLQPCSYEPTLRQVIISLEHRKMWPSTIHLHHVNMHGWYSVNQTLDELHPSVEGHKAIAVKLAGWLKFNRILD